MDEHLILLAFLVTSNCKLLWNMEAMVYYNMMADFERKPHFERNWHLKAHSGEQQITAAREVVLLKASSSLLKWHNSDILPGQRSLTAALHHIANQWNLDGHKIQCRQCSRKALLYHKSPARPPCYSTTPGLEWDHSQWESLLLKPCKWLRSELTGVNSLSQLWIVLHHMLLLWPHFPASNKQHCLY